MADNIFVTIEDVICKDRLNGEVPPFLFYVCHINASKTNKLCSCRKLISFFSFSLHSQEFIHASFPLILDPNIFEDQGKEKNQVIFVVLVEMVSAPVDSEPPQ